MTRDITAIALLPLLTILYAASSGPLLWLDVHNLIPEWAIPAIQLYEWPLEWVLDNGPVWVRRVAIWYGSLWA